MPAQQQRGGCVGHAPDSRCAGSVRDRLLGTGLISIFFRHRLASRRCSAARRAMSSRLPTRSCRRRAGPATAGRSAATSRLATSCVGPRTRDDRRSAGWLPRPLRADDAPYGGERHYFFGAAYFDRALEAERTWLALGTAPDGALAAASLAAVSDGFLHYYLSGSADSHLRDSPMKNVVTRLVEHSADLGLPLNLGGGLARGDALEEFKRGFANRELAWRTSEVVCDRDAYDASQRRSCPRRLLPRL